ncbi:PEGA domain-containing protein [Sorangium sp. So ce176]|uniref:PEGA domain-containing protein n=1 Tax=Sorangium sp. So ce176 TaxID=3133286 RepID=UPI003F60B40A
MMMNCRSLAVLFTAATVMAAADVASAQPAAPQEAPASAGDAVTRADAFYRHGLRLYSDKKYVEAEKELESAWELNPTFDVAYNLGNTKYQLKKHREAATYLSFALRNWPLVKTVAKLKPTAEQRFAESRAQVGAVAVTVGVAGAEVLVDGEAVGRAPLGGEVFVEPGEHQVEARLPGYETASQTVSAAKGGAAKVELPMTLAKSEEKEATPVAKAAEGASSPGGAPAAETAPAVPVGPIAPQQERSWVPAIALGAASVVGLGVGVATTVASSVASDDAHKESAAINQGRGQCVKPEPSWVGRCEQVRNDATRADTLGNVARVAYIASGVFAISAVTYALWPTPKLSGSTVALPVVRADGAGISVMGAW